MNASSRALILCFFSLAFLKGISIPTISGVTYSANALQYEKFEITFDVNIASNVNPYNPSEVDVYAEFWGPNGIYIKQNAFKYFGVLKSDDYAGVCAPTTDNPYPCEVLSLDGMNSSWKIRIAPTAAGAWSFRINSTDATGSYQTQMFSFSTSATTNKGFIRLANKRYLKFDNGTPYYPVGNSCPTFGRATWRGDREYGTNQMKYEIDAMDANNVNFFRFEINFNEGLSLYGTDLRPPFTNLKKYHSYFNQLDSWQMDEIVEYARSKDINMLIALFAHVDFGDDGNGWYYYDGSIGQQVPGCLDDAAYSNGAWTNFNPFNKYQPSKLYDQNGPLMEFENNPGDYQGYCENPYQFLTEINAKKVTKAMFRYIIARWGYATNIMGFELFDEADRFKVMNECSNNPHWLDPILVPNLDQDIINWHTDMANYIRSVDPFDHLLTTAYAGIYSSVDPSSCPTCDDVFPLMDFTQTHHYVDYPTWAGFQSFQGPLFGDAQVYLQAFDKPHMTGEYGYLIKRNPWYDVADPEMYDVHCSIWATLFNGSMGASSFWVHQDLRMYSINGLPNFQGIGNYVQSLPQFSERFFPKEDINHPRFRTYYLRTNNEDEYYGWMQDTNFTFRNIYGQGANAPYRPYLVSYYPQFRPPLTSTDNSYSLPVTKQGTYDVSWYNTITGVLHSTQVVNSSGGTITISMPQALRDGKFADAAFVVKYRCENQWNVGPLNNGMPPNVSSQVNWDNMSSTLKASGNTVFYRGNDYKMHVNYWTGSNWWEATLGSGTTSVRNNSDIETDGSGKCYYTGTDNKIHRFDWNGSWSEILLNPACTLTAKPNTGIAVDPSGTVYFVDNTSGKIAWVNTTQWGVLAGSYTVAPGSDLEIDGTGAGLNVYFASLSDYRIWAWNSSGVATLVSGSFSCNSTNFSGSRVISPIKKDSQGRIYFVSYLNKVHYFFKVQGVWLETPLSVSAPQNVKPGSTLAIDNDGNVHFVGMDNRTHLYYFNGTQWIEAVANAIAPSNVVGKLATNGDAVFYHGGDSRLWSVYWGCKDIFMRTTDPFSAGEEEIILAGANDEFSIFVYPNPVSDIMHVQVKSNMDEEWFDYSLIDINGRTVASGRITREGDIDLGSYAKGIYYLDIRSNEKRAGKKVVIR